MCSYQAEKSELCGFTFVFPRQTCFYNCLHAKSLYLKYPLLQSKPLPLKSHRKDKFWNPSADMRTTMYSLKILKPHSRRGFRLFQFIPTLFRDYHLSYFTSISSHFSAVLGVLFFILFSLSSLVLQNMLQLSQKNNSRWLAPCFIQDKSPAIKLSFCKL